MTLESLNTLLLQAEERGDGVALAELVTDDFTIIRASGVHQNKSEFVVAAPGAKALGRSASEVEITEIGEMAVVRLKITTQRNPDGTVITRNFRNTRVFVQVAGEWKCRAWHSADIG